MGDWGDEDGAAGASAWYLQQASELLDETSAGFGTFVNELTAADPVSGRLSGTLRGAAAMFCLVCAGLCIYQIWRLCHAKAHIDYRKLSVAH